MSAPIYNQDLYPLHDLASMRHIIADAQRALRETGVATFPHFLTQETVAQSLREIFPLCANAFVSDKYHNAYLETDPACIKEPDRDGARGRFMRTQVASVAYDELGERSTVVKLYKDDDLTRFIRAVLGKKDTDLFVLEDPIGAATINLFKPGFRHAWHFDESEFTTTLCLQMPEKGGEFVYTPPLRRSAEDLADVRVMQALEGKEEEKVLEFAPGTLALFAGRYSLHKVNQVEGERSRLVAVFCYASTKGFKNSPSVQKQFWGRTKL